MKRILVTGPDTDDEDECVWGLLYVGFGAPNESEDPAEFDE